MIARTESPGTGVSIVDSETVPMAVPVAGSGTDSTFEAIYETHFRSVYRYALLATGRPVEAEDTVAETFARALAAWSVGNGPSGRPLPWLLLICRRIVTDRWRRQRLIAWLPLTAHRRSGRDQDADVDLDPGTDDPTLEAREFWLWLDAVTKALPERQREVLFLRYERDLTDNDIAEVLGLTASGVRSLTARAIASLRSHPELLT